MAGLFEVDAVSGETNNVELYIGRRAVYPCALTIGALESCAQAIGVPCWKLRVATCDKTGGRL